MSHVITNQPFALVRDRLYGTDEWYPLACVEAAHRAQPSPHAETVLTVYDFWFVRDEVWCGPFRTREQAANFLAVAQSIFTRAMAARCAA